MGFVDIIAKKRDGQALDRDEIERFIAGVTANDIPDYQTSALLMAIVLRGMTADETVQLTDAMVRSGERIDLSDIPGVKLGKHSTGGVGDKTSLLLAPLVAACGLVVPKMSGRGLGHTGGTLDKLESIPGYRTRLSIDEFKHALRTAGCSIIGPTATLAPADKKLYALRDVTGTVESVPLIAASIMSKKLAEGGDALLLDVKCGRGALMKTEAEARTLAGMLVMIGNRSGLRTEAMITGMDSPLGRAVGNALEIIECVEILKGQGPEDLTSVTRSLASRMLVLSGTVDDAGADAALDRAVSSGKAIKVLRAMLIAHGADPRIVDDYGLLPTASSRRVLTAPRTGYVAAFRADLIGRAAMALGAGRQQVDDRIDHAAGIVLLRKPGEQVQAGDPLLELHYNSDRGLNDAVALASQAIEISAAAPSLPALVLARVA